MSSERPYITCHVLDTVSGKPARGIPVHLELTSPSSTEKLQWSAVTDKDGRVGAWEKISVDLNQTVGWIRRSSDCDGRGVWKLTFDTESYFGQGNTFWPEVELKFATKRDEDHYHVPLLLGPWSYTTYRGS